MKIKCISNERKWLKKVYEYDERDTEIYYNGLGPDEDYIFPLSVGKEYMVYGMVINCGCVWYFIANEDFDFYPVFAPAPLFEVVDNRLSKYWVYSHQTGTHFIEPQTTWAFPEWAEDPDYYTKLIEGYEREKLLFNQYKSLLDNEN